MRYLYTILLYLMLPLLFLRLLWRSRHLPAYRSRWQERVGYYSFKCENTIWVHAVSVGETMAAVPLVRAIQAQYPSLSVLMTTMTPTGAEQVRAIFGDTVRHAYLPYDLPAAMRRFLDCTKPKIAIMMETELWPNLLHVCHERSVPVCLLNARLSERSARGYQRIASLTRKMLSQLTGIAAHAELDAERFIALGAPHERVIVTGNIKFDLAISPSLAVDSAQLRAALGQDRFIWIAASTHEGEEEQILAVHQQLRAIKKEALLILVPRHPDRFQQIGMHCQQHVVTARRSLNDSVTSETAIYLGDTMGELLLLYGAADAAFVGGSLVPRGGHNFLEPAALAKPIVVGPHLFNFTELYRIFVQANALMMVQDKEGLFASMLVLMNDSKTREQLGRRAHDVFCANQGALRRQLDMIEKVINL